MTWLIRQHAKSAVTKSQHKKKDTPKKKKILVKHTRKSSARSKIVKKVTFDDEECASKAPQDCAGGLASLKRSTYYDPQTHIQVLKPPPFPIEGIREDPVLERFSTFVRFLLDHLARCDGLMYQKAAAAIKVSKTHHADMERVNEWCIVSQLS